MVIWGIVLLSFDLALMGAILYILVSRKNRRPRITAPPEQKSKTKPRAPEASPSILAELKEELSMVKRTAADLDRKRSAFDAIENSLHEKIRKLDEMIRKANESVRNLDVSGGRVPEDTYSKAMKMLRMGVPAEEVIKSLGILNGELELISALNDYKN